MAKEKKQEKPPYVQRDTKYRVTINRDNFRIYSEDVTNSPITIYSKTSMFMEYVTLKDRAQLDELIKDLTAFQDATVGM